MPVGVLRTTFLAAAHSSNVIAKNIAVERTIPETTSARAGGVRVRRLASPHKRAFNERWITGVAGSSPKNTTLQLTSFRWEDVAKLVVYFRAQKTTANAGSERGENRKPGIHAYASVKERRDSYVMEGKKGVELASSAKMRTVSVWAAMIIKM